MYTEKTTGVILNVFRLLNEAIYKQVYQIEDKKFVYLRRRIFFCSQIWLYDEHSVGMLHW